MMVRTRRGIRAAILAILAALALVTSARSADEGTGRLAALVTEGRDSPVEDAVVSLTPLDGTPPARRPAPAVMDQQNKEFVPHVLPVLVGTPVTFPNRDNIRHHVYSFAQPKKFELPLYSGTPATPVVFDKPGVVPLGCNIHDWMLGYVYVVATPLFAKTGRDGRVRIDAVPAGRYEAQVWHPRLRDANERITRPLTIEAGAAAEAAFPLTLKRERPRPRTPNQYQGVEGG